MRHLLLLPCLVLAPDPRSELTTYIPMEISAPSGDKAANIKVVSHVTRKHKIAIFMKIISVSGVHPLQRAAESGHW